LFIIGIAYKKILYGIWKILLIRMIFVSDSRRSLGRYSNIQSVFSVFNRLLISRISFGNKQNNNKTNESIKLCDYFFFASVHYSKTINSTTG